jgi:hypothetical protein
MNNLLHLGNLLKKVEFHFFRENNHESLLRRHDSASEHHKDLVQCSGYI